MRIVIMADGRGSRWENHLGIPKHFVPVKGEKLIGRTVRLLTAVKTERPLEVIVTSHDGRYEFEGCIRYEPQNNIYEIDRFTEELIEDDMCFLYGDTYYTEETLRKILEFETDSVLFFGNRCSIVGVKIKDAKVFKKHKDRVKRFYLEGKIEKCIGWQVFQSLTGQNFDALMRYDRNFVFTDKTTRDINTPKDYKEIVK